MVYSLLNEAVETAGADISSVMNSGLTMGERVSEGLKGLAIGMLVVFSVLALLWLILVLFRIVFYDIPNKKKVEENKPVEPQPLTSANAPSTVEADDGADDEEEIVAAITAAIAVCLDKPQTSFRVVSFRRTASK